MEVFVRTLVIDSFLAWHIPGHHKTQLKATVCLTNTLCCVIWAGYMAGHGSGCFPHVSQNHIYVKSYIPSLADARLDHNVTACTK